MIVIPALDLMDKKVVRLQQGDFAKVKVYSSKPLQVAYEWVKQGAQWLHVVDLDGAQSGKMKNLEIIRQLAQTIAVPIEVGGGIRREKDIAALIEIGVQRVILGTRVIEDQDFLKKALAKWPAKIAVSLDCREGKVVTKGWVNETNLNVTEFAANLEAQGVPLMIFTDIKRDGMLQGPNLFGIKEFLKDRQCQVILSGGITSHADIEALLAIKSTRLWGVIIGKALFEGTLNLKDTIALCSQNASFPV